MGGGMTTPSLTTREKEILDLLCAGKTAEEMGSILSLSTHTVRTYQAKIKEKAGVYKDTALVSFAYKNKWVEL
jgi:DNA-binding CsgD family transcriptional regulator